MKKNQRRGKIPAQMESAQAESVQSKNGEADKSSIGLLAAVFFVAITAFFPLFMSRTGYIYITKEKTDIFLHLAFIASIGSVIALLITAERFRPINYFYRALRERPLSVSEWAIAAFLLLSLVSSFASPCSFTRRLGKIPSLEHFHRLN